MKKDAKSKCVVEVAKEKTTTGWPQDVVELAGCWKNDFPTIEEIRTG